MKTTIKFALALAVSVAGAGAAVAHGDQMRDNHHREFPGAERSGGMPYDMHGMMDMMMGMQSPMFGGGMMGPGGPGAGPMWGGMGRGPGSGMMMDDDMMRMMMGPGMMGGAMMGQPTPEAARSAMLARLTEFDADKDGTLSLDEFEALHSAMIRETTVDRFQHLDADGDGKVTPEEMGAPARRMDMWQGMPGVPGMPGMPGMMRDPSGN